MSIIIRQLIFLLSSETANLAIKIEIVELCNIQHDSPSVSLDCYKSWSAALANEYRLRVFANK